MSVSNKTSFEIDIDNENIDPNEPTFWIVLLATLFFLVWGVLAVFYFSRISGILFTFLIDKYMRFSKNGIYFQIASVSITGFHAGKIMFRNVVYDNGDMTVKINDGYLLFRYWKSVEKRKLDLKQKRTSRLLLSLNGLQINVYNNLSKYSEIAKIRQFSWFFEHVAQESKKAHKPPDSTPPSSVWENLWNLVGTVQVDISTGFVLLGNEMLPYALWLRYENINSKISLTESANDRALMICESEMENVNMSLIKNEKHKSQEGEKDPPKTSGKDGFVLLQTASLHVTYKQDILGYVTEDVPQSTSTKRPIWSSQWKFGNNTVIAYGPWAEQQRALIYNFFYPFDYQNTPVTSLPTRGHKRIQIAHEVSIIFTKETSMNIWFMRGDQLESITTRCDPGSFLNMNIMWITTENGFTWNMDAKFINFQATTSLIFTKFLECQNFVMKANFDYPLSWNGEQKWNISYEFHKATMWFVWDHKRIFTDLIDDWMGEEPSDIAKFIPFTVNNRVRVVDGFEVIMLLNECNWVDVSDKNSENVEAAIVGKNLNFDFILPFTEFLPKVQKVKYKLRGEKELAMRVKYPDDSATSAILASLIRMANVTPYAKPSTQGNYSLDNKVWHEIWRTEKISMNFDHRYHPLVLKDKIKSDIPFAILHEFLPDPVAHPWDLETDKLVAEIIVEGSDIKTTGLLVKNVFELKNNYFGWYDSMTSVDSYPEDMTKVKSVFDRVPNGAIAELYRPMEVDVVVRVRNARASVLVYSPVVENEFTETDLCPVIYSEEVVVEVKKTTDRCLIQVGVAPATAYLENRNASSQAGFVTLSGLQFRAEALYSSKDVVWDMGMVEYGWLMEIIVGDIVAKIDFPAHALMLHQLVETLLVLVLSPDDAKIVPERMNFCQHGKLMRSCDKMQQNGKPYKGENGDKCLSEEVLKYKSIRVSVDSINISLVEEKTIIQLTSETFRFTLCNAHESKFREAICVRAPLIQLCQVIQVSDKEEEIWLESGKIDVSGISLDIELPKSSTEPDNVEKLREAFIRAHDKKYERLQFLYSGIAVWGCACYGNTEFFAKSDVIGSTFLNTDTNKKLFVPSIATDRTKQPQILQSIFNPESNVFTKSFHSFYSKTKLKAKHEKKSSCDTDSFHSAKSQQQSKNKLINDAELMKTYEEYVNNHFVKVTEAREQPEFEDEGAIERWIGRHPAISLKRNSEKLGVNEMRLEAKQKSNPANKMNEMVEEEVKSTYDQGNMGEEVTKEQRLYVSGTAATHIDVFFTPLGVEALDRLALSLRHAIPRINPCLVVHMCYRECVLNKHRQPLTESLFENEPSNMIEIDVAVELPQINLNLFQCELKKVSNPAICEPVTASMALFVIERANIHSKTSKTNGPKKTIYQMNCKTVCAQILQITNKKTEDFGSYESTTTSINWESTHIAQRMPMFEPRVMFDFNIPDVSVILEREPCFVNQEFPRNPLRTTAPPSVPVNRLSLGMDRPSPTTPTPTLTTPVQQPQKAKKNGPPVYKNSLKALIGSVNTSIVMARPQEMTAGNEFPIYEALSPVILSWITVVSSFIHSINQIENELDYWGHMSLCRVLKHALDCTEDKVAVRLGKNRMSAVKVLGRHQNGCASCLLIHTLFRWFGYAKEAPAKIASFRTLRDEFNMKKTRKAAVLALLSHWQPDVGRHLKLVSFHEANKFKVLRVEDRPLDKTKRSEMKINMTGDTSQEPQQERKFLAGLSPTLLKGFNRKKAGYESVYNENNPGKITARIISPDSEDDSDDTEKRTTVDSQRPEMDLYTWMRNAQREKSILKRQEARGRAGAESETKGNKSIQAETSSSLAGSPLKKDYVNPMDIQQKSFFYSLYRFVKLQWSALDGTRKDTVLFEYSLLLEDVDLRVMTKRIKSSTDLSRQFITPAQQQVMQMRNTALGGLVKWKLERDEKRKTPLRGEWNIDYVGKVESIRFLIGVATASLAKELLLVVQAGKEKVLEAAAEKERYSPLVRKKDYLEKSEITSWDAKVLDMTQDYEKNIQRILTEKPLADDTVHVIMNGDISLLSMILETVVNDLYVSTSIQKIELSHKNIPLEAARSKLRKGHCDEKRARETMNKVDEYVFSIGKASATLRESDSLRKMADIFRCTLNTSSLSFNKILKMTAHASASKGPRDDIFTNATIKLGVLEGNMPMAAHSLHDVVMRHGKELEQHLNRLAAQPTSNFVDTVIHHVGSSGLLVRKMSDVRQKSLETKDKLAQKTSSPATNQTRRPPIATINFLVEMSGIEMNIQLLPSLQAKYKLFKTSSTGITGDKAHWTVILDNHYFEFCVTGQLGKTENFRLQLPSVKCVGHYSVEQGHHHKPSTDKKLVYREGGSLHTTVVLGTLNHTFTTELLNQLLFAEQSFRTEFTSLINRLRSNPIAPTTEPSTMKYQQMLQSASPLPTPTTGGTKKPQLLFSIKVTTKDGSPTNTPWLQLTASSPQNIAFRFTIDSLEGELTNKWVVKEEGSKERIYGSAIVHFNAKLGQLVKIAQYPEVMPELQEYATFMTQVRVENKERNVLTSAYSYHITLNRPYLLIKASAVEKAILLWLDYKHTYDYWREERDKVFKEKTKEEEAASKTKATPTSAPMFSPQIAQDVDMNLSLAINNGMYMAMPLYGYDVTEGMPALVISLQKSEIAVLVKRELTCKATFKGFKLSFVDDFDEQALTQGFLGSGSEHSNCFFFPEGTYQLCSKASAEQGPPKWKLSLSAEMQGVEIDLDQRIGKLAKLLINTFSIMSGNDDDIDNLSLWEDQQELDSDEEKVEGAAELRKLRKEDRVPWLENKMHHHSRNVYELAAQGVSNKKIEAERHKLRQYELIRFKAFRRNMVDQLRKARTNMNEQHSPRRASIVSLKQTQMSTTSALLATQEASLHKELDTSQDTVYFDVDVKVNIATGTCTLRTAKKEGLVLQPFIGQFGEALKRLNQGARDIKAMLEPPVCTSTTFSIPSVELKAYHASDQKVKTSNKMRMELEKMSEKRAQKSDEFDRLKKTSAGPVQQPLQKSKKARGVFYMFVGLASMPNETVVTPHLATYLEQVLEPLPAGTSLLRSQTLETEKPDQPDTKNEDVNNIVAMDTAALPIDVVLLLDVQSSTIRFDGKTKNARNQSAADCQLILPRLTMMLTSRQTNDKGLVGGMDISGQFKGFLLNIYSPHQHPSSSGALKISLDLLSFVINRTKNASHEADNRVRFVLTSQISKATFEYDMRRLGELIQFPRPWYRATIARRVFFGDQTIPRARDESSDATGTTRSQMPPHHPRTAQPPDSVASDGLMAQKATPKPWFATVLVSIQWEEFDVFAQMSNTMGKTTWKARRGRLNGNAKLNSKKEYDVSVRFKLGSSELVAKEGAISGEICFKRLAIALNHSISSSAMNPPLNELSFEVDWITANIEWMSRRVLLAKWVGPAFRLKDYYTNGSENNQRPTLKAVGLKVHSSWQDLKVVIMKTTIDDVTSIVQKLISFFEEQLKSSKVLWGRTTQTVKSQELSKEEPTTETKYLWEKLMDVVSEMQMNEQLMTFMENEGVRIGGEVQLKANKISLVLMQGDMNANSWAVFHLQEACIVFSPESILSYKDEKREEIALQLVQKFTLRLGKKGEKMENLANVCKVNTRRNTTRNVTSIEKVLDYLISDVLKEVGLHRHDPKSGPKTSTDSPVTPSPMTPISGKENRNSDLSVLELFQFPGLEAVMTSEQKIPLEEEDAPVPDVAEVRMVHTSFVCDFYSEVAIETDFNAQVSFLPDLLKSYLNEPTTGAGTQSNSSTVSPVITEVSSMESQQPPEQKTPDPRIFVCQRWVVEPRIRFIDRIKWKPPVVDDILKKLQIFDHRNTIPKVIQRAVLDPLDVCLAKGVSATLKLVDHQRSNKNKMDYLSVDTD